MKREDMPERELSGLPTCAEQFIATVIRKMRWRRRIREDVQAELTAHFEDELRDVTDPAEREKRARQLIEQFGDAGLLGVLCRRAKKRCRPLWRKAVIRTAQVFGLSVLYLFICSLPLSLGKPTIRVNYIEWLNNRWQPAVAAAANAAPLYDQAAAKCVQPPESLKTKQAHGSAFQRSLVEWFSGYGDQEKEALKQWLVENQPAFDALREASRMPEYWPVYDASLGTLIAPSIVGDSSKVLESYRRVALALREQIAWEASQGRIEDALDDCLTLRRFGRHLQDKGFLNDQLIGASIESIGHDGIALILHRSKVPGAILKPVQEELQSRFDLRRQVVNLDGEKAFWYDNIQRGFTDDGQGGGHALGDGFPFAAGDWRGNAIRILWFNYPDRRETVAMVERYFERAHNRFTTPPNERDPDSVSPQDDRVPAQSIMLTLLGPAHTKVSQQVWRLKTHELATIVLLAIQRYAGDTGSYPASMEQLAEQGYLKNLPQDPYGRGPLAYNRSDEGFLLYSWGPDLEDDGGHWGTNSQGEPNRWAENGDWVFWPVGRQ
jgi:hypothetical protein